MWYLQFAEIWGPRAGRGPSLGVEAAALLPREPKDSQGVPGRPKGAAPRQRLHHGTMLRQLETGVDGAGVRPNPEKTKQQNNHAQHYIINTCKNNNNWNLRLFHMLKL